MLVSSKHTPSMYSYCCIHVTLFTHVLASSAEIILTAVKNALELNGVSKVVVTGHSLGGAIALLDAVYLPLHLPGVTVEAITYGLPRVGNQEFADYVDANVPLTHITNKYACNLMLNHTLDSDAYHRLDIVPIIPGRFLGYTHPAGEVHIDDATDVWNSCAGQDNEDTLCSTGAVDNIFTGDSDDHKGPYNSIIIGCHYLD